MKQNLTISLIQANQIWENKEANFDKYEQLFSQVVDADVVLLPEMFNTGFSMNAEQLSEPFENSISINWLKKMATNHDTAIYTSLIIKEGDKFFNRGVFVEENGTITIYDKQKTFGLAGENKIFESGKNDAIIDYKGWKIKLQICYDLRFPEIALNQEENGKPLYDLLLYVANWPERRNQHWKTLLPARAIENQCYVAAVNRVGLDASDLNYSGDSCVIDLLGNHLASASQNEMVLNAKLAYDELQKWRNKLPFLKDRKI